ncbi:restriction endonuclease subunit S [Bifidobacterium sp. UTCIF-37]|nr:restriction endonuclease subunit S [Bifidobacterium sp. UTCIF-37]TPF87115.1 restriction endonuclease subunit S [Bifidobacterium sp. UTCIF-38]
MTSVDEALSYDADAIGIGRKGTIDHPYKLLAPFWTVDTLFYAVPRTNADLDYVLCLFLNIDWQSKNESTGLPSLSKLAINESVVTVCSLKEQQAIGRFFSHLDDLITLHQRKHRCLMWVI